MIFKFKSTVMNYVRQNSKILSSAIQVHTLENVIKRQISSNNTDDNKMNTHKHSKINYKYLNPSSIK